MLAFTISYPKHLSSAYRAYTLGCWPSIFHSYALGILYFSFGSALHAVCLHLLTSCFRFIIVDKLFIVGMPIAFSSGDADFSGLAGSRDLWIADVIHKAHKAGLISLDEADRIWDDMISKNRKLPASSFSKYISKT
jgi:hypothetical protein